MSSTQRGPDPAAHAFGHPRVVVVLLSAASFVAAAAAAILAGGTFFVLVNYCLPLIVGDPDTTSDTVDLTFIAQDLLLFVTPLIATLGGIIIGVLAATYVRHRHRPHRNQQ